VWSLVNWAGCGEGAHLEVMEQGDEVWLAGFGEGLDRLTSAVWRAAAPRRTWLDRVRAGLVAFLGFFDDEPGWAEVLLFDPPLSDGAVAARCGQWLAGVLTVLLDDGQPQALGELTSEPQLTAELVAGGVVSVVRRHVREGEGQLLVELAPSLVSFVVGPYLGHGAAQAELMGASAPVGEVVAAEASGETTGTSYKRASTSGPRAQGWTASGHPRGAGRSLRSAHSKTSGVGGSPGGGLADRSIVNREDKGVVDK
jgi:hypothetical protein